MQETRNLSGENSVHQIKKLENEIKRLEKALISVKNELEAITDNSRDYIIRYNKDLKVIFASTSLCEALNKKTADIIGRTNTELGIPVQSTSLWDRTMRFVLRKGKPKRVEFEIPFKGTVRFYEALIVPEKKADKDSFENILSIVRDVTLKKKTEKHNQVLVETLESQTRQMEKLLSRDEIILNNMTDGIIIYNAEGHLIYMNEASRCFYQVFNTQDLIEHETEYTTRYDFYNMNDEPVPHGESPLQKCSRKEKFTDLDYKIKNRKTGKIWYSSFSGSPVFDSRGNFIYSVLTVRDITEKKAFDIELQQVIRNLEEEKKALAESEQRYRNMGETVPFGVWSTDASGNPKYISPSFCEMIGKSFEEIAQASWIDSLVPDQREKVVSTWKKSVETGEPYENESHFIDKTGEIKVILSKGLPVYDSEGKIVEWAGINLDITDRKKIENELRSSEERFRKMFEMNKAVMLLIEPHTGIIVDANTAAAEFYGYSKEELKSRNIRDINTFTPEEIESERKRALEEHKNYFIFPHRLANGNTRWVEVYSSPINVNEKVLLFSIIHDITERITAEQALNESREDLSRAQKVAHIGSWNINSQKNELVWSDETYRIFSVPLGTPLTYEKFLSLVHPEDRRKVDNRWKSALLGSEYDVEHRILANGTEKWVRETAELEFDQNGKVTGGFGTVQDITRQKETEQERERLLHEVKLGEQKLKWALEAGNGGAWDWDTGNDKLWWSPELYSLYGISEETAINYTSFMLSIDIRDREKVLNTIAESMANRTEVHYEFRINHPKLGERWMESHGKIIYDDIGLASRLIGITLDVTNRKKSESALRESEEKFSAAFRSNTNALIISDVEDGKIIDVNESFLSLTGMERKEVIGKSTLSLQIYSNPADRDQMVDILKKEGNIRNFEIKMKSKNGEERIVLFSMEFIRMSDRNTILSTIQDITERREIEEKLRQNEMRFREAFEHAPVGMALTGLDGAFLYVNEAYCQITGYDRKEILSPDFNFFTITRPEDREENRKKLEQIIRGEVPSFNIEKRYIRKDGSLVWIRASASARRDNKGAPYQIIGLVEDISERRKIENALRENQQRLQGMFNNVAVGIVETDFEDRFIVVNDRICQILGYPKNELLGKSVTEITAPEDRALTIEWNSKIKKHELDFFEYEKRYIRKDGSYLWVHVSVTAIHTPEGGIRTVGTISDISSRKIAEEKLAGALAESEKGKNQLQYIIEAAELGTWDFDIETGIAEHSFRHDQIFGYTEPQPEWSYETSVRHILPEYHQTVRDAVAQALETGILNYEAEILWPDGSIHWIAPQGKVQYSSEGKPLRMGGIVADISERKRAEKKLAGALAEAEEGRNILTALMENIPMGITIANVPDVNIRMISKYGQDLMDRKSGEIDGPAGEHPLKWGTYHSDGITPALPEELPLTRATLHGEYVKNEEWCVTRKDGARIPILCNAAPIRDNKGIITGGVIGWQDISEIKKTQQIIKKEHELLQTLIDTVPAMITIYDPQFQKIQVNQALEKITGWTNEDAARYNLMELVYPDPEYRKMVTEFMQSLSPGYKDLLMKKKDGQYLFTSWANVQISDGRQVGIGIDISGRKKMEEELRQSEYRFREATDNLPYSFAIYDKEGKFKYINKFGKQRLFLPEDQIIGKTFNDIFPDDISGKFYQPLMKTIETLSHQSEEFTYSYRGSTFTILLNYFPVKMEEGKVFEIVGYTIDITEMKKLQEQLQKKNTHLTKVNELLEDFVHIAAHDLRGPIASMIVMNDYIALQPSVDDKMELFDELIPLAKKLQRTVDGLMETINVQKENKLIFKEIWFESVFNQVSDDLGISRLRCTIEPDFFDAPSVHYIESYLVSIMKNLLSNAIKYSAENQDPLIRISTHKHDGYILLTVSDNGMGIDLKAVGRNLFKPFKRFTKKAEGTGMGLYIIKNIIEKNGGYIEVKSSLNSGTTFYCYLQEYTAD